MTYWSKTDQQTRCKSKTKYGRYSASLTESKRYLM